MHAITIIAGYCVCVSSPQLDARSLVVATVDASPLLAFPAQPGWRWASGCRSINIYCMKLNFRSGPNHPKTLVGCSPKEGAE